jgi:hypothetical protein
LAPVHDKASLIDRLLAAQGKLRQAEKQAA